MRESREAHPVPLERTSENHGQVDHSGMLLTTYPINSHHKEENFQIIIYCVTVDIHSSGLTY
jgi:hypothetical protein